jgi:hypothetical protein
VNWPERLKRADPIKLVIAGSYSQYKRWCRERRRLMDIDCRFIDKANQLRGYDPGDVLVVFVGTYWENPMYDERTLWERYPYQLHRERRESK